MTKRSILLAAWFCCALFAVAARAELRKDIEFAKPGGFSLTLDAYVPDGSGPFPAVIIVHGGGFARGDKQTYVPPLFLLIHGTEDAQVYYQQSVVMQQRMKQAGNVCDLITVEGGPHGMGVITKFPDTKVKMIAWLKTTLKLK